MDNEISKYRPVNDFPTHVIYKIFTKTEIYRICINVKGYPRYKTILCQKVALDVQLMNFLSENKMFRSRDIEIFVFL